MDVLIQLTDDWHRYNEKYYEYLDTRFSNRNESYIEMVFDEMACHLDDLNSFEVQLSKIEDVGLIVSKMVKYWPSIWFDQVSNDNWKKRVRCLRILRNCVNFTSSYQSLQDEILSSNLWKRILKLSNGDPDARVRISIIDLFGMMCLKIIDLQNLSSQKCYTVIRDISDAMVYRLLDPNTNNRLKAIEVVDLIVNNFVDCMSMRLVYQLSLRCGDKDSRISDKSINLVAKLFEFQKNQNFERKEKKKMNKMMNKGIIKKPAQEMAPAIKVPQVNDFVPNDQFVSTFNDVDTEVFEVLDELLLDISDHLCDSELEHSSLDEQILENSYFPHTNVEPARMNLEHIPSDLITESTSATDIEIINDRMMRQAIEMSLMECNVIAEEIPKIDEQDYNIGEYDFLNKTTVEIVDTNNNDVEMEIVSSEDFEKQKLIECCTEMSDLSSMKNGCGPDFSCDKEEGECNTTKSDEDALGSSDWEDKEYRDHKRSPTEGSDRDYNAREEVCSDGYSSDESTDDDEDYPLYDEYLTEFPYVRAPELHQLTIHWPLDDELHGIFDSLELFTKVRSPQMMYHLASTAVLMYQAGRSMWTIEYAVQFQLFGCEHLDAYTKASNIVDLFKYCHSGALFSLTALFAVYKRIRMMLAACANRLRTIREAEVAGEIGGFVVNELVDMEILKITKFFIQEKVHDKSTGTKKDVIFDENGNEIHWPEDMARFGAQFDNDIDISDVKNNASGDCRATFESLKVILWESLRDNFSFQSVFVDLFSSCPFNSESISKLLGTIEDELVKHCAWMTAERRKQVLNTFSLILTRSGIYVIDAEVLLFTLKIMAVASPKYYRRLCLLLVTFFNQFNNYFQFTPMHLVCNSLPERMKDIVQDCKIFSHAKSSI